MRNIYFHINKKKYQKPVIEEILIDREMSLVMSSQPPTEPEDPPELPLGVSAPDYGTEYPMGGSRPVY